MASISASSAFTGKTLQRARGGPEVYPHRNMSDVEAETDANIEQEAAPSSPTAPPPYESIALSDLEPAPAASKNANSANARVTIKELKICFQPAGYPTKPLILDCFWFPSAKRSPDAIVDEDHVTIPFHTDSN